VEAIYAHLVGGRPANEAQEFEVGINDLFEEAAVAWRLDQGLVRPRGTEAFEAALQQASEVVASGTTAAAEIHEALVDLSRKPKPDLTGAIQHALAALECQAREFCGKPKLTLGPILKKYPDLLPVPLNQAVEKIWGYASERGRHLREGRHPGLEEAELVVGLAVTVVTYLARKTRDVATKTGPSHV